MPGREVYNEPSMTNSERVFDGDQCLGVLPSRSRECPIEVVGPSHLQGLNLYAQRPARSLRLLEGNRRVRIGRIPKHGHASEPGVA